MNNRNIAIDGPAGAGKSTIAKLVAKNLNLTYIDTGAMYRAVTLKAIGLNIDLFDDSAFDFILNTDISFIKSRLFLDKEDVTDAIRDTLVSNNVSKVASHKIVREYLVKLQQNIASSTSVVMDGRDIGFRVLPKAKLKIYLTATIEERAQRRHLDNIKRGIDSKLETITEEIKRRDHLDQNREIDPLRPAKDSIMLDTTSLSIEEVVNHIIELFRKEEQ